jgi:galactokinase
VGPIAVVAGEERKALDGLRVLVSSDVPEGKGVSSSAALELAAVQAAAACLGRSVEPQRLALLAQEAEHRFAGAPCGVMDQMTAACGEAGRLLALLCRPAEILGSIPLPTPLTVWGVDSGVRHAVAGDDYARVRCATFMGKTILGVDPAAYLTELEPSQVDLARLPEQMSGDAYLCSHGPLHEEFSEVEPAWVYPVRAATLHAIEEHLRVRLYAQLLGEPMNDDRARLLGELMFQSHASYSRCGLGCAETDAIVEAVRRLGWSRGLAGARITGGGSGGTVVVLGRQVAEPLVATIATELAAGVVSGSSDGAALFGVRVLRQRS